METMTGKIPILMYHEIYGSQEYQRLKALTNPAYNTSLSGFRKQMAWLHENKVQTDADLRHVYPIPWSISQAIGRYGRKRDYL
jgi:hypothetical protein